MIIQSLFDKKVPLLAVCSYGRSGTTVFMKLMRSIGANVEGALPFEDRTLQVSFLNWMSSNILDDAIMHKTSFCGRASHKGNQYWSTLAQSGQNKEAFEEIVRNWIDSFSEKKSLGIAEKFIGLDLLKHMKAFDDFNLVRPIFLLRDPRDVFISVKEFNAKRGFTSFNDEGNDERLLGIICGFMRDQIILQRRIGGIVCRYEELMLNPERAIFDIARFCSMRAVPYHFVERVIAELNQNTESEIAHMTSASQGKSIVRWKGAAFSGFRNLFENKGAILNEVGYPA